MKSKFLEREREYWNKGYSVIGVDEVARGCETIDAEVLTKDGFKNFDELNSKKDFVLSYTPERKIVWQKIDKVLVYEVSEDLFSIESKLANIVVTKEHSFPVVKTEYGMNTVHGRIISKKFLYQSVPEMRTFCTVPRTGEWAGKEVDYFILPGSYVKSFGRLKKVAPIKINMDAWLSFFGIWTTEGCIIKSPQQYDYRVIISQKKETVRKNIRKLLKTLPWNFCEPNTNLDFVISSKQLWEYLRQFGNKYSKYIPTDLKNLSQRQLRILFDWLVLGDGHIHKPGKGRLEHIYYFTTSKRLVRDVEEIIVKLGNSFHTRVLKNTGFFSKTPCYSVRLCRYKNYNCNVLKKHVKTVPYAGKVFDLQLPRYHNFFVKRNGSGYFTGNSIAGPITAAAVVLSENINPKKQLLKVNDSKQLKSEERERLFKEIEKTFLFALSFVSTDQINKNGLHYSNKLVCQKAIENLLIKYPELLQKKIIVLADYIGGAKKEDLTPAQKKDVEVEFIKHGDEISASIMCASIVAKVTRDHHILELDKKHPEYDWKNNKGYRSRKHLEAIKKYGATKYHRMNFLDVKRNIEGK